jgi:hypothetical protein
MSPSRSCTGIAWLRVTGLVAALLVFSFPPTVHAARLQEDALASVGAGSRRIDLEPSPLVRLGRSVEYASADLGADFAHAALAQMLDSYREELDEVQIVAASRGIRRHQSWSAATHAYLRQLSELLRLVEEGATVGITISEPETVQLMISGQPVIVQGPRLASPRAFEQRIVENFCLIHHCPEPAPREAARGGRLALPAQGIWSFSDSKGHAFETAAGLRFVFRDLRERRRKQKICLRLSEELTLLAAGLESTRSRGVPIDWESLEIVSLGDGYPNKVTLNGRGDYFELKVPYLGRLPTLWKQATPWLQAQVAHQEAEHFFADADHLLNPLLE